MTPLPSTRKRAEEFADAVDALLVGAAPGAAPAPLLDVVVALRSVPEPTPRPAFTADLRRRLLAEATAMTVEAAASRLEPDHLSPAHQVQPLRPVHPLPPHRSSHHPGRLVAAATVLVVVGGTAGVTTASRRAVPGDALYPVKRVLERAELELSVDDRGRGRDLLEQATHRLDEVQALLPAAGSSLPSAVAAHLPETVRAFRVQAVEGSSLLLSSFEEDRDPRTVVEVRDFTADSVDTLTGLAATAPSDVLGDLGGAAVALQAVDARAFALCSACDDRDPLEVPEDLGNAAQPDGGDHVTAGGTSDPQASPAGVESPGGDPTDPTGLLSGGPTDPAVDPTDASATTPGESADPTDTPSEAPTDTPTEGTSEDPGSTPADTPTAGPTEQPTDGGSGSTDQPTDPPTDQPTDGTPDPTEESSDGGTGPTGGVTSGETSVPSSGPPSDSSPGSGSPVDQTVAPDPSGGSADTLQR